MVLYNKLQLRLPIPFKDDFCMYWTHDPGKGFHHANN